MRRFIEVVVFSAEFAFWAGCCFLEKLCSRFYTKLVCCYETDPLSLVNCRHFVFSRLSARSSCSLFPNRNGHGGGGSVPLTSGLGAAHHPLRRRQKSQQSFPPVCVFKFPFSLLSHLSWGHKSTIHVPAESPLRVCRSTPPAPSDRLLYFFVKLLNCPFIPDHCHLPPPTASSPWRDPHCTCPSVSWGLFLLDNIK